MSDITFNPPPGWPAAPAGALPPESWKPDPSWSTPPAGWVFYRDTFGNPATPPVGSWVPSLTSPVAPAEPAPATPVAPTAPTAPVDPTPAAPFISVLDEPAVPFTPPTPPPTMANAQPITVPEPPAAAAWMPTPPPEGSPQFPPTPQFGAAPQYGIAPQQQPLYTQYQPGTPYGQPTPPKKNGGRTAAIVIAGAILLAAAVFLVHGLINGFPWSNTEPPVITPPVTTSTEDPPPAPPTTTTTTTTTKPPASEITLDQFRTLATQTLPSLAGTEAMTVNTAVKVENFYKCTPMEELLPHLVATAFGSWNNPGLNDPDNGHWQALDMYLFDSPDAAAAMGIALRTCWHSGGLTVDERIVERNGVTNYFYEAANAVDDQADNLVVYGNVAIWPDTLKSAPFDAAQQAWEDTFAFGYFAKAVTMV